ncbi:transmembrane protein, putative (macronuclear) [Tetrahymena thermophila SB210]|uniref:Transmembrane protein, putative n=1 Tax=Tetrahymena thermophila (strain SB210) TaxID=312017 RepID=W7XJW7_TETTS|nr:transmembrane protein, putative [Tetrahymena thermophila SB210]EWS76011.1 transmembrane protein, putative [Tetrahymena thermophila SB210]|eukprot:XP_012651449.1 transmembrane protein, putative [Tetrahymena thermophila SB210]
MKSNSLRNTKIYKVIAIFQFIFLIKACNIGCQSCSVNSQTGYSSCLQCEKDYLLDKKNNICVYQNCHNLTYLEINASNSNLSSCVPLCNESNQPNLSQNICQQAIQCSTQYVQPSQVNKGRSIKSIFFSNMTDQIFLVYDQFINAINQENGSFMRSYTFDSSIFSVYQYKQNIFLFGDQKNSVFLWNPMENILNKVLEISQGTLKVISQVMEVANNKNILLITSIDDANKIIFFTQFNTNQLSYLPQALYQISVRDGSSVYLFQQLIIQQTSNWQIKAFQVIQQNSELQVIQITPTSICSTASGIVQFAYMNPTDQSIIIQFQNTSGVYQISSDGMSCKQIIFNQLASQIKYSELQINNNTYYLIFAAISGSTVQVFDLIQQQLIFSIQSNNQIIDFQTLITQQTQNQAILHTFLLTNIGQIENFTVQITQNQNQNNLNSIIQRKDSIQSLIQNPSNLLLSNHFLDSNGNTLQLQLIFLVYQNAQIIKVSDGSTLGLAQDFQDKLFYNQNAVNAVTYSISNQLIVSCGSDGRVFVWQAVDLAQPVFLYLLQQQGQQCIDVQIFQSSTLIIQFQTLFQIINIYNYIDSFVYPIQSSKYTKLQVGDAYFFILTGTMIQIFKQKEQIYYQAQITTSLSAQFYQFFLTSKYQLIIVDSTNTILPFSFVDGTSVSFGQNQFITPFISAYKIVTIFYLPQQNGSIGDLIILNDSNKNVIVLDIQLQIKANQTYNYGLILKAHIIDNYFLLLIKVYNPQSVYAYGTVVFDYIAQQFVYLGSNLLIQEMPLIYKNIRQDGSIQYSYVLTNPIGYTSYTLRVYWYPQTNIVNFDNFNYSPGQNLVCSYGNTQKNLIIAGSQTGQVRLIVFDNNITPQSIYTPSSASDNIQSMQISFTIGMYFIVTSYQIKCFSIHTEKLLEILSFKTLKSPLQQPAIQNLIVSNNLKILISYTQTEIILKNFNNNQLYSSELSLSSLIQLKLVNGAYIDEDKQQIYIYGSDIVLTDTNMGQILKLTTLNANQQYNQCIFTSTAAYCSMNQIQLHIFVRQPNFSVMSVVIVQPAQAGFQFIVDVSFQQIIVYKQLIDLYSVQGVFIQTISTVTANIIYLKQTTSSIVVFTTSNGYIFSRGNFEPQGSIQPAGGFIISVYYIESMNQIAFFTNQILFGQILFYNLNNQQSAGFISNTYKENGIGRTVQVSFDNDSVMLNYLDNYGNFQNVIFSTSKTTDNQIVIPQIQNGLVSQPQGYLLDFDQNSVYIYGSDSLFKINYNIMTRPIQRIIKSQQKLQFILQQNINGQTLNTIYLVDYWNNLFLYYDYQVIFQTRYANEVIDLFTYSTGSDQLTLICFLDYILVFKNTNNFQSTNAFLNITSYKYKKLLLNSQGRVVFNTWSNQIIDFDWLNNQQLAYLKLDVSDLVICTLQINNPNSQMWYLFVGTQLGNIIQYDINNKNMNTISFESNPVISIVISTTDQLNIAIITSSGNIFEINCSTLQLNKNQNIQQNKQTQTQDGGNKHTQVSFLFMDFQSNRYFINLEHEKSLGIYSLIDQSFVKYISFPDNEYKQIIQNQNFIILASAAQINVFDNNLNYINRLRRYNRKDRISDIQLIDTNKVIIVFTTRIECVFIDTTQMVLSSVDQVQLTDSRIILTQIIENQNAIHLIGISQTSIFEKKISLGIFVSQNVANLQSQNKKCLSSLQFTDSSSVFNQFDYIISTSVTNISFVLSILVGSQLRSMQFLQSSSAVIIIRPIDINNNILNIDSGTFQLLPFNVNMDNFKFQFNQENAKIMFHKLSQNVTFQDIKIQNQNIPSETSLIFENNSAILIQNLTISNVNFTTQQLEVNKQNQNTSYYFLNITQCQYIYINQLNLVNVNLFDPQQFILSIQNSNQVFIQNINIVNSTILGGLFIFQQIKNITFSQITLTGCLSQFRYNQNNQNSISTASTQQQNNYIFTFIGINNLQIYDYLSQNNTDLFQILTDRQYQQDQGILTLSTDVLIMKNITLIQNNFPRYFNSFSQLYIFQIQSSINFIEKLKLSQNQGNFYFYTSNSVQIQDSVFDQNIGVLGGSISFESIQQNIIIINSNFTSNEALSSGGAIIISNSNQIKVDQSYFISNKALIGGAIRIVSSQLKTKEQLLQSEIFNCIFSLNQAQIYGNNIGRYPSFIEIYIQRQNEYIFLDRQPIQTFTNANVVNITNLQSGGLVPINIKLLDDEKKEFSLQTELYMNNKYPQPIQNELSQYFLEITTISSVKLINQEQNSISSSLNPSADIKGEALVTSKQFNQDTNSFSFSTVQISYIPKQTTNSLVVKLTISNQFASMIIPLNLSFRQCIKGEILVKSSNIITTCQECQEGTYSLINPNQIDNIADLECKKCPLSAKICSKDQIILEAGYWRINNSSDNIIECNTNNPNICDETDIESKNGCIKGYIGPLCETCDIGGYIWGGERYTNSFAEFQCNKCSSTSYQALFIGLTFAILSFYLFLSIILFMNSYIYNSTCCYLRLMCILPMSKSSIKDESTFYIKALVNYLQLSACLFKFQISFLPQIVAIIPSIAGQPVSKIIVSSTCIYDQSLIDKYGEEKIRVVVQAVIPFFFCFILFVLLFIFQKLKLLNVGRYHKYLMVNFLFLFFQPDSISFYTLALSCRQIGDLKYNSIKLTLLCNDSTYSQFKFSFILPMLLLWILSPLIILVILLKYNLKKKQMHFCTTKYKYGYFYIEYKKQYCYWEFIRIYYRIVIVITVTLFENLQVLMYLLCVIIIFIYIFFAQRMEPFDNKHLLQLEILSCFILIFNVLFSQLNKQYPSDLFQVCLGTAHYGFIIFILVVIFKIKLQNSKSRSIKLIKKCINNIFLKKIFGRVVNNQNSSLITLLRWRKVFKNLLNLRKQNALQLNQKIENQESNKLNNSNQSRNISKQQPPQARQIALSKFSQNEDSQIKQNQEQEEYLKKVRSKNSTTFKSAYQTEYNSPAASFYKTGIDTQTQKFQIDYTIGTLNDQIIFDSKDPFSGQDKVERKKTINHLRQDVTINYLLNYYKILYHIVQNRMKMAILRIIIQKKRSQVQNKMKIQLQTRFINQQMNHKNLRIYRKENLMKKQNTKKYSKQTIQKNFKPYLNIKIKRKKKNEIKQQINKNVQYNFKFYVILNITFKFYLFNYMLINYLFIHQQFIKKIQIIQVQINLYKNLIVFIHINKILLFLILLIKHQCFLNKNKKITQILIKQIIIDQQIQQNLYPYQLFLINTCIDVTKWVKIIFKQKIHIL